MYGARPRVGEVGSALLYNPPVCSAKLLFHSRWAIALPCRAAHLAYKYDYPQAIQKWLSAPAQSCR